MCLIELLSDLARRSTAHWKQSVNSDYLNHHYESTTTINMITGSDHYYWLMSTIKTLTLSDIMVH